MDNPLVSIIVPTFNRLSLLSEAIGSILNQTYSPIEIVISNNASTDGTSLFLKKIDYIKLTVIENAYNVPLEVNVTNAVGRATGKYFMILSDDDLISNNYIDQMVEAFEADASVSVGLGRRARIDANGSVIQISDPMSEDNGAYEAKSWLVDYCYSDKASAQINTVFSTFYRRNNWVLNGGQPPISVSFYSDTIPFLNSQYTGSKVFYSPHAIFFYRSHPGQGSKVSAQNIREEQLGVFQFVNHLKYISSKDPVFFDRDLGQAVVCYILKEHVKRHGRDYEEEKIDINGFLQSVMTYFWGESEGSVEPTESSTFGQYRTL